MSSKTLNNETATLSTYPLHDAILCGNFDATKKALEMGADVNAFDAEGKTVLSCAIVGVSFSAPQDTSTVLSEARHRILRDLLLPNQDLSLLTLNAPLECAGGVTPLALAAWLNKPADVIALLETGQVAVDGKDGNKGTALMYAARDGSVEVVRHLLAYGARPDICDCNNTSALQLSVSHPEVVWLLESHLRRQRADDKLSRHLVPSPQPNTDRVLKIIASTQPPTDPLQPLSIPEFLPQSLASSVNSVVYAIESGNLELLHALLFPSAPTSPVSSSHLQRPPPPVILSNHYDAHGFAPLHRAASIKNPSVAVFDALFRFGADFSLTTLLGRRTVLHCLARSTRDPYLHCEKPSMNSPLYNLTVHLIHDLRAPLAAQDVELETCLHIAAEHGESVDVLLAFLDCDQSGILQEMRNDRGLRPIDVAKTKFKSMFSPDETGGRPISTASSRTIVPHNSQSSLSSLYSMASTSSLSAHRSSSPPTAAFFFTRAQIQSSSQQMLDNLARCTLSLDFDPNADLDDVSRLLNSVRDVSKTILNYWKAKVEEGRDALNANRASMTNTERLVGRARRFIDAHVQRQKASDERIMAELNRSRAHSVGANTAASAPVTPRRGSIPLVTPKGHNTALAGRAPLPISTDSSTPEPTDPKRKRYPYSAPTSPTKSAFSVPPVPGPPITRSHRSVSVSASTETLPIAPRRLKLGPAPIVTRRTPDWLEPWNEEKAKYRTHEAHLQAIDKDLAMQCTKLALLARQEERVLAQAFTPEIEQLLRDLMSKRREEQLRHATLLDEKKIHQWTLRDMASKQQARNASLQIASLSRADSVQGGALRLQIVYEIDEEGCAVGRETKKREPRISFSLLDSPHKKSESAPLRRPISPPPEHLRGVFDLSMLPDPNNARPGTTRAALLLAPGVFEKVYREMDMIEERTAVVERQIEVLLRSLERAQDFIDRALHSRKAKLAARESQELEAPTRPFSPFSPVSSTSSSPTRSFSALSINSLSSSNRSIHHSPTKFNADDDLHALQRLLMRKIAQRVDNVLTESEHLDCWLHIIRDVMRHTRQKIA